MEGGMVWRRVLVCTYALVFALAVAVASSWASSPRYRFYDEARVLEVQGPNLLKLKLLGKDQIVVIRLLGVGSPRNRDRVRGLSSDILSYIHSNQLFEASCRFVRDMMNNRVVQVWARRWNQFDEKGRLLAYVLVPSRTDEPLDLNGEIIRKGLGFVTRDYVHVTFVHYKSLEEEARRHRRGIWRGLTLGRVSSLGQ
jgi:endonuclease YncB( thermonuclease family)